MPTLIFRIKPAPALMLRPAGGACLLIATLGAAHAAVPPPPVPAPPAAVTMSPFEVSTQKDVGYISAAAGSAGRVAQDLRDVPQSISVINQELIRDLAPSNLDEILALTASVDMPGDDAEIYTMRGDAASVPLTNGFRVARMFPSDIADVERVEVMDGPAASTFGDVNGNGGVINKVSKKPRFTRATSLLLSYVDASEMTTAQLDYNTPLGTGQKAAFRLVAVGINSDRHREKDFSYRRFLQVMPKFLYRFTNATQLTVEATFGQGWQSLGQQLGLNYDYILYRNPNTGAYGTAASTTSGGVTVAHVPTVINVPDAANPEAHLVAGKLFNARLNFTLNSQLNEQWAMQFAGYFVDTRTKWYRPTVGTSLAANPTLTALTIARGRPSERERGVSNNFVNADLLGKYAFDWGKLHLSGNAEYAYDHAPNHIRTQAATTVLPPFSFLNPDYNVRIDDATFVETSMTVSNSFNTSGSLRGFLSVFKDRVLLSGSERWMKQRQTGRTSGLPKTSARSPVYKTPFYGLTLRPVANLSFYASHTEGMRLATTAQPDGILLPPTINEQNEYGMKTSLLQERLTFNAAYFENARVNILERDPITGDEFTAGRETAKGYDLRLQAVIRNFQILSSYSHTVKQRTSSINPALLGEVFTGFTKHRAGGLVSYSIPSGPLRHVRLGAGAQYQSKRVLRNASATQMAVVVPQSIRFNAFVAYRPRGKAYELQANVDNIEDVLWYPSGTTTRWNVGTPRTIKLQFTYNL
jgi:outer membrane receptor for ferric coprogen and ferric-rhodotorulic acid